MSLHAERYGGGDKISSPAETRRSRRSHRWLARLLAGRLGQSATSRSSVVGFDDANHECLFISQNVRNNHRSELALHGRLPIPTVVCDLTANVRNHRPMLKRKIGKIGVLFGMTDEHKPFEVFLSHFGEEQSVAEWVQEYIWSVFGDDLRIFRSSDDGSIRTGVDQYPTILQALAEAGVFIILVSKYSAHRPWVNFEAGFAKGRGIDPFTVLIRHTNSHEVPTPLSQLQLRPLSSENVIDEIVAAISAITARSANGHNARLFISQLGKREAEVPDRELSLRPFRFSSGANNSALGFEIVYKGQRPLELRKVSADLPWELKCQNWHPSVVTGHLISERVEVDGKPFLRCEYIANMNLPDKRESGFGWRPLCPHLEPSDQPRFLRELRFALTLELPEGAGDAVIRSQILTADGNSPVYAFRFGDIEIRPSFVMPG